ncbi:glycosyl hydrolase family 61-domain-containing protein [Xylaria sp. FL0064]|nr:glycosyl hydrolase family 61-domain-containing protein [Xylaria sp. FL0064]
MDIRRVEEVDAQSKNTLHYPQFELGTLNETCGRGAWKYAKTTDTAALVAGSEIAFGVWEDFIFHPGPGHVYLAKVPESMDIGDFIGHDGDWFKIAYFGPRDDGEWERHLMAEASARFTIPATTPPEAYLMRMEHLYLSSEVSARLQLYVNCAQININGPGGGKPTEFLKFPGSYIVGEARGTVLTKEQAGHYEGDKYINALGPPKIPATWSRCLDGLILHAVQNNLVTTQTREALLSSRPRRRGLGTTHYDLGLRDIDLLTT